MNGVCAGEYYTPYDRYVVEFIHIFFKNISYFADECWNSCMWNVVNTIYDDLFIKN